MKNIPGLYRRGKIYWYAKQANGKRHFFSLETSNKTEAMRKIGELDALPVLRPGGELPDAIARFLAYRQSMGEYSQSTIQSKGYVLKDFGQVYADRAVGDVTGADVQRFYDDCRNPITRGLSDTTANGYIMLIRAFFRWVVEVEKIRRDNPAAAVKLAKVTVKARLDFCEKALRDKLIAECPREDLRFVLFCGFHVGMRFQEIVEAKAVWFDLAAKHVHLRKHPGIDFKDGEERTVPMTNALAQFLAGYGLREPYMLHPDKAKGKSIYRWDFGLPFEKYMASQGVPWVTPHIMRHTFASLLASAGVSIYKIAQWLGDDVRVAQRHYAKLSPGDLDIERAFS